VNAIPDEVVFLAWEEFLYPRTAHDREPSAAFLRAVGAINRWLAFKNAAVVPPKSDRPNVWIMEDGDEIRAGADPSGAHVTVEFGDFWTRRSAEAMRRRALAMLAAADRAERLAPGLTT
jgi:hypothetical protein